MAIIGLLLLLLALAVVIGIVVDNNVQVIFSLFGTTVDELTVAGLFVGGVLTAIVGVLGLWMMKVGAARSRRRRIEAREERERERVSIEQLALEREQLAQDKAQLEAQLQRERGRAAASARPTEPDRRTISDPSAVQRQPETAEPRRGDDRPTQPTP